MRLKYYLKFRENVKLVFACIFFSLLSATAFNQVSVTATAGVLGPTAYTNLSSAFTAINSGTHQGAITIDISASYTDVATAVLNSSGAGSAVYTSVLVRPSVDGVTISFASVSGRGVIELNGADNVTIDGDNPNTAGTNRDMTIVNTALNTTTYTSVVRIALSTLVTSGNSNTIKNCIITGNATGRNISTATSTTGSEHTTYGILVGGGASTVAVTTAPSAITSVSTTIGSGITATSFTADNNRIDACARGIAVNGSATTVANLLTITNNVIGSSTPANSTTVYSRGMSLQGFDNTTISGNTIQNMAWWVSTAEQGIGLGEVSASGTNAIVEKNTINGMNNQSLSTFGVYGINVAAGANNTVRNNVITNITGDISGGAAFSTTFGLFGIRLAASTGHKVYYNSVNMYGLRSGTATATSLLSACVAITSTTVTGCDIRNNVLSNTQSGGASSLAYVCLFLPSSGTSTMNLTINNNVYYCGSTVGSQGICHVGTTYTAVPAGPTTYSGLYTAANFIPGAVAPSTNLRSYTSILSAAGTNDNASSASTAAAPFTSSTDLHINVGAANYTDLDAKATPIAGITLDFDGNTRDASTPDIGMDEFAAAACTGVPAGGTISPATASACAASTYTMTATGAGAGLGISYQWEISSTGGGLGFSDVTGGTGATSTSYTTAALTTGTYYYRLKVTCSTGPDISYSNELTLTVNPSPTPGTASGPLSGETYTNYNYTLTGYTPGSTFQWQVATALAGPYADIVGATADNTTLFSNAGATFYIRCKVSGGGCSDYSNVLTVVISVAGDNVCSAIPIAVGLNGPYTNSGATTQVGEPQAPNTSCSGQSSWCTGTNGLISNSVWFSFTAPASGRISVHFSPANWDSQIALWSAADCSALLSGGQTMIAANDDSLSSPFNAWIAPVCVTPGQTYWLQVDGYGTTVNTAFSLILQSETNAAPVISGCPGDITVTAGLYSCSQTVSWTAPTASDADNCVSPLSFTSTYSPGASFPIGTTLVTYTASDGVNTPVTCSFNVTVNINAGDIWYADNDGDGYGNAASTTTSCSAPLGYVLDNTDCDDLNGSINPGATEICNFLDDDCDGTADEGIVYLYYFNDADGDGYGAGIASAYCSDPGAGFSLTGDDCNDLAFGVNPGATEVCGNGIDDNCNGSTDEGCTLYTYYADTDGDGYGDAASFITSYSPTPPFGYVADNTDCNDASAAVNPAATEICNFIDDDCDGSVDEGIVYLMYYNDADGDGYGAGVASSYCTDPGAGFSLTGDDCNDLAFGINPGATEVCNGIDDDCDGLTDEGLVFTTYYADTDGDTYGDAFNTTSTCDGMPAGYVNDATDCDDANNTVYPGATEICDGLDNDCDGLYDEGTVTATVSPSGTVTTCKGDPIVLTANGGPGYTYQWFKNGNVILGATSISYGATKSGNYSVQVTVPPGCFAVSSATAVIANPKPNATISAPNGTSLCTTVKLKITQNAAYSYQWYKDGSPITGATSYLYIATAPGNYNCYVVATATGCFRYSAIVTVTACKEGTDLSGSDMELYPNPTDQAFTIDLMIGSVADNDATIQIFNMMGEIVYNGNASVVNHKLSQHIELAQTVQGGVYFVKVAVGTAEFTKQLILQK